MHPWFYILDNHFFLYLRIRKSWHLTHQKSGICLWQNVFLSNVVEKRVWQITCLYIWWCNMIYITRLQVFWNWKINSIFLNKRMKKALLNDNTIHQKDREIYYFDVITFHVERKISRWSMFNNGWIHLHTITITRRHLNCTEPLILINKPKSCFIILIIAKFNR